GTEFVRVPLAEGRGDEDDQREREAGEDAQKAAQPTMPSSNERVGRFAGSSTSVLGASERGVARGADCGSSTTDFTGCLTGSFAACFKGCRCTCGPRRGAGR